MSGFASSTAFSESVFPLKSGVSTSITISASIVRIAWIVSAKWFEPPSARSSRATAVITTCLSFILRIASATRAGSSPSNANGFAVDTAQNPHARVHLSPAIMKVAVPWLQHSHRFGHCADSQTVCSRRSEMSAFVEKNTGLEGSRTLIHPGFFASSNDGSICEQDIRSLSYWLGNPKAPQPVLFQKQGRAQPTGRKAQHDQPQT